MGVMEQLAGINQYSVVITGICFLVVILLLVKVCMLQREVQQMKKRYLTLTRGLEDKDYGELLTQIGAESSDNTAKIKKLLFDVELLNQRQLTNLNRVAMMHYNAFDFTYGELSFSLAVLDDLSNGFIFTNIHNRDDARCYCKRIIRGESKHTLSDEEKEVLEYAIHGDRDK